MTHSNIWCVAIPMLLSIGFHSCKKDKHIVSETKTGSWDFTAGKSYPLSFRNHHYTFTKTNDDTLTITLEANNENAWMWLYKGNDFNRPVDQPLWQTSPTVSITDAYDNDEYTLVVGTVPRGETDSYTLTLEGPISGLAKRSSQTLEPNDADQTFEFGGGGHWHEWQKSFRNDHYTFRVSEENSMVDINLSSMDEDVYIHLYDSLDYHKYPSIAPQGEIELVREVDIGTYYVIVCISNEDRDNREATYNLSVNGQITNLNLVEANETVKTEIISNGAGNDWTSSDNHVYEFEVTSENSTIDIIHSSTSFYPRHWIIDEFDKVIDYGHGEKELDQLTDVDKGIYQLICGTSHPGDQGQYKLSVVGRFKDFHKIQ